MHSTKNWINIVLLTILILSSSIFTTSAFGQSIDVSIDFQDLQEIDKRLQNFETLKEIAAKQTSQINELTGALKTAQDTIALHERENALNDKILAIKDQEIEAQKKAIADLRDISDRAIKLAESKKSNIWDTYGPIAVIAILVVTIASIL